MNGPCIIEGCEKPIRNKMRGLCEAHYQRYLTYGDPLGGRRFCLTCREIYKASRRKAVAS